LTGLLPIRSENSRSERKLLLDQTRVVIVSTDTVLITYYLSKQAV
jgi:hypothetical protein